jgi:hypothetical protein
LSGYGASSGYGVSSDHGSSYGSDHSSGYGYGGYEVSHKEETHCCPLVVDPLCLAAILLGIAAATYLLQIVIAKTFGKRKRKRRYAIDVGPVIVRGRHSYYYTVRI